MGGGASRPLGAIVVVVVFLLSRASDAPRARRVAKRDLCSLQVPAISQLFFARRRDGARKKARRGREAAAHPCG